MKLALIIGDRVGDGYVLCLARGYHPIRRHRVENPKAMDEYMKANNMPPWTAKDWATSQGDRDADLESKCPVLVVATDKKEINPEILRTVVRFKLKNDEVVWTNPDCEYPDDIVGAMYLAAAPRPRPPARPGK